MPLDPSIYNQPRVNLGAGLSSLLDEQRKRELDRINQANAQAAMAQQQQLGALQFGNAQRQQEAFDVTAQQEAQKRAQIEQTLPTLTPQQQQLIRMGVPVEKVLVPEKKDWENPEYIKYQKNLEKFKAGLRPTKDWENPEYVKYQQDLEKFKAELKPNPAQQPRKPMTADQEAKYRQKFGEAYGTTINALQSSKNVTDLANELKTHKGLGGITGYAGYAPDFPGGDAAGARQKFETLQGKITKMAKDAAASSGSIGPMAVQEWKILRDQVAAIDPAKLGVEQMQSVLDDLIVQAENAARITEEAYISTFSPDFEMYPQFADPRSAIPPSAPHSDTPKVGAIVDGYVYVGGDPANPASWKGQ